MLPVTGNFIARTSIDENEWSLILPILKEGKRIRIPLNVDIFCEGEKVLESDALLIDVVVLVGEWEILLVGVLVTVSEGDMDRLWV